MPEDPQFEGKLCGRRSTNPGGKAGSGARAAGSAAPAIAPAGPKKAPGARVADCARSRRRSILRLAALRRRPPPVKGLPPDRPGCGGGHHNHCEEGEHRRLPGVHRYRHPRLHLVHHRSGEWTRHRRPLRGRSDCSQRRPPDRYRSAPFSGAGATSRGHARCGTSAYWPSRKWTSNATALPGLATQSRSSSSTTRRSWCCRMKARSRATRAIFSSFRCSSAGAISPLRSPAASACAW